MENKSRLSRVASRRVSNFSSFHSSGWDNMDTGLDQEGSVVASDDGEVVVSEAPAMDVAAHDPIGNKGLLGEDVDHDKNANGDTCTALGGVPC